ncbi:MAG TPA: hypothetical protein GXX29_02375 [Firmicutes bacterium]|nr:hypothetical protein [Bacillota bacterium]
MNGKTNFWEQWVSRRKYFCWALGLALACLAAFPGGAAALSALSDVTIANEYISITVNNTDENTGRFAVSTTGGDPDRTSDDDKHLIYRRPGQSPWTSYTTLLIDGTPWVFGGKSRDAGTKGRYGEIITPPVISDERIVCAWQLGPIAAEQSIRIVRSSTTGLLDTASITYTLHNRDQVPHEVGLRVALDTMLGENDGAPFRVGDDAVTVDTVLSGADIPDFWQAFDSLLDPKVTAQGTLRGGEVTTPDRVYFTNWGALAEGEWEFSFSPGRDFTRLGEFDLDSATALLWDPVVLPPGAKRTYVVYYGLGGISISPGQLQLGLAAPTQLVDRPGARFQVVAYIQNRGDGEARDVIADIRLPAGLDLVPGQTAMRSLGTVPVGQTVQVKWDVVLARSGRRDYTYSVGVRAMNAEPNELSRSISVISPARLTVKIAEPEARLLPDGTSWQPLPFAVTATITNEGEAEAYNVLAHWSSERGLRLAAGDITDRLAGTLAPGESSTFRWHLMPTGELPGNLPYSIKATSYGGDSAAAHGLLFVPALDPVIYMETVRAAGKSGPLTVGEHFQVVVKAANLRSAGKVNLEITYNPLVLEVLGGTLGVERGTLFESAAGWSEPELLADKAQPPARLILAGERTCAVSDTLINGTVAVIYFRAVAPGISPVTFDKFRVLDCDGQEAIVQNYGLNLEVK